jgi:type IV secretory pathway VirB3-like protein
MVPMAIITTIAMMVMMIIIVVVVLMLVMVAVVVLIMTRMTYHLVTKFSIFNTKPYAHRFPQRNSVFEKWGIRDFRLLPRC